MQEMIIENCSSLRIAKPLKSNVPITRALEPP